MDMLHLAQTVSLALPAMWLTLGVRDNIFFPSVNETFTAQVFTFERMRDEYPDEYERLSHRSITRRTIQRAAFLLVILAELSTLIVLWAGVAMLALALFGSVQPDTAKQVAMLGALMFTCIWGMFLVVGENFAYWFCHEGAQNTHFQMTLWGMANLILLAL